jgi:LysR family glycine cleavage system transcriptional activator
MRRILPSLTALRAFEAAARNGSFKAAAGELHVTEAAVSRQIRLLETDLGARLFDRLNRRVELTPMGAAYFASIREAFDIIDGSTRRASRRKSRRTLVLAVDPGLAVRWLIPRMRAFRTACPDVEVEIHPSLALTTLPHPEIDAVIFYGRANDASLRQDFMMDVTAFPVCIPAMLKGPNALRRPADLSNQVLLHETSTDWWERWLSAAGCADVDGKSGTIYHDTNFALDAAVLGEGVAVGDDCLAYVDLKAGRLVRPFPLALNSGSYFLIYPGDAGTERQLAPFREWLLAECRVHNAEIADYRARFENAARLEAVER